MNRAVGLAVLLFIVLALFVPTTTYSESQLLYVKEWYGVKYYFYSDRVVISYGEENITLYNMLDAIVSKINLVSYQLLISNNNVTYYYSVDVKIFGKTYSFKILQMFLFSMTGTCKIKVVIDLPVKIPRALGKALFKWRLIGNYNIYGYRVMRKRLFIDFSDMARTKTLGKITKDNGYIDIETTGFDKKIVIDPVVGVVEGSTTETHYYTYYSIDDNVLDDPSFENYGSSNWYSTLYNGDIYAEKSTNYVYDGSYSLRIYANGTTDLNSIGVKQQFSNNNVLIGSISLYLYVVDPVEKTDHSEIKLILIEVEDGSLIKTSFEQNIIDYQELNQWNHIEIIFDEPIPAGFFEIVVTSVQDTCDLYFDLVTVNTVQLNNNTISWTKYYWVYSDSNATYKYTTTITIPDNALSPKAYLTVPKGYDVENITVNNTLIDSYEETPYNDTHKYINITLDCTTCNVSAYFTAWNSVTDLYSDYKYYPYSYNATIHARLLDPYLNPINGTNITLWIGAQYKHNETILTTQAYIGKGYIIAPHLKTWRFDGQDDYVEAPDILNITNKVTLEALIYVFDWSKQSDYPPVIVKHKSYSNRIWFSLIKATESIHLGYEINGQGWNFIHYPIDTQRYVHVAGVIDDKTVKIYIDGELKKQGKHTHSFNWSVINANIRLGKDQAGFRFNGYISFVRIYNRALSDSEVSTNYNDRVVNASGLVLFLDPTFFNGTHYLDLLNSSLVGTPYNGVERVEADEKWLWIVENAVNDNYVHLKYFPIGSVVRFKDPDTGVVVREVFISSNDEVVDLPSGNYTVEAIIADGYYEEYTIITDDNGWANITITTPNNDASIIIQAEYNDTYAGVKNTTIYSTGYSWSITYTPSTAVRKGENITLEFSITRTVDNSKPDGWLHIVFNNTSYQNEVRSGYTSRVFINNISGKWNITITSFDDSLGDTVYINSADTLTWCGVKVAYSVSPQKYYYNINDTVIINYDVFYDTGQHDAWNITILYNGKTLLTTTNYTGSFAVKFETSTNILEFRVLELDGNYTIYTYKLYALHLSIEPYMIKTLSGEDILYAKLFLSGYGAVIGEYLLAAYTDKTNKTVLFFTTDSYSMQLYLTEINVSALRVDVTITNLEKQPMDYNISLTITPYYFRDITYTVNIIIHVEPYMNNYTYTTIVFDNRGADNILSYTLIVVHGNTTDTFTGDLPFVIGYGLYKAITLYKGFSAEDTATTILTGITADNVSVIAITPLGLSTGLVNATDTSKLYFTVSIDTNRIYESGETISIKVNVSSIGLPLYIDIKLADMEYKYTAMNTTYNITVPELPAYQLTTYTLKVILLVNNDPVQEKVYSIMVFNTGPKIMLVEPHEYSQLNGTITITLYVYDDSRIESVLWKWDFEEEWHNATLDGYYAYITYDTLKIQNGLARLMVKATDKHGYVSDAVYYFNIYNPVNEVQLNQLWYNIGQWLSRYIFIPGLITGIITTSLGVWLGYAIRKRKEKKEKIIVVVNQKGVANK